MSYPKQLVMSKSHRRVGWVTLRNLLTGETVRHVPKREAEKFARRERLHLMTIKESEAFHGA